jgi:hypothetical protein
MNTIPRIPDAETRSVRNMQKFCRQLEIATSMLDEAIAIADQNLRMQRLTRLQKRTRLQILLAKITIESSTNNTFILKLPQN